MNWNVGSNQQECQVSSVPVESLENLKDIMLQFRNELITRLQWGCAPREQMYQEYTKVDGRFDDAAGRISNSM